MEIKRFVVSFILFVVVGFSFAKVQPKSSNENFNSVDTDSFIQGLSCYRNSEWSDASTLLSQAAKNTLYDTDAIWYMIIMSYVYSGDFTNAINACDYFMLNFQESQFISAVEYQRGRALYSIGQRDSAVMALGSFCNAYPESEMYSSALYWIAECFYDDYDFETSKALYEKVVDNFPTSVKYEDAKFKIYLITQRDREEKLLYLLKMTGEEYINSKENYERELKMMQSDDVAELRRQLIIANNRIRELEENNNTGFYSNYKPEAQSEIPEAAESSVNAVNSVLTENKSTSAKNEEIYSLKEKAALIQKLLDEKYGVK